jgi:hypothetical protein
MAYPHFYSLMEELSRPSFVLTIFSLNLLFKLLSFSSFIIGCLLLNFCKSKERWLIHTPILTCKNFLALVCSDNLSLNFKNITLFFFSYRLFTFGLVHTVHNVLSLLLQ